MLTAPANAGLQRIRLIARCVRALSLLGMALVMREAQRVADENASFV